MSGTANRDKAREAERRYRARHLEEVRARQAKWHKENRAKNPEATRKAARDNYVKHRKRIRAQAKKRYDSNPERDRQYSRDYRTHNRERANAIVRKWRKNNPAKAKAIGKSWYLANPDAVHACRKRRRARIACAPINDFTAEQWIALQLAFDHRCAYCDKRCKGRLTQDHVQPLSKGGSHTASNIVPACGPCNSTKHTGPPLRPVQPLLTL